MTGQVPVFCTQEVKVGTRGPVPKRSDQRVRRNQDEGPIETIDAIGPVDIPDLGFDDPHPLVVDLYRSLTESAQSKYYEPSDWQFARFALHFADALLKNPSRRGAAQMLVSVNQMLTDLLVSEGSRRRVRLEIERDPSGANVIDVAEMFRQKMQQG
ncbi:hypothetical protein [Nocardia abscessus]|uniref:phage terminase small subunit n=1 Tax=Nocardia abscessus TaxID=120957 RepID=UPI0024579600|nr:hypothetical protein [Nocardia abscessus]